MRLITSCGCLINYLLALALALGILEATALLDVPPLVAPPALATTACTICPALLKTMLTKAFNGEYWYCF